MLVGGSARLSDGARGPCVPMLQCARSNGQWQVEAGRGVRSKVGVGLPARLPHPRAYYPLVHFGRFVHQLAARARAPELAHPARTHTPPLHLLASCAAGSRTAACGPASHGQCFCPAGSLARHPTFTPSRVVAPNRHTRHPRTASTQRRPHPLPLATAQVCVLCRRPDRATARFAHLRSAGWGAGARVCVCVTILTHQSVSGCGFLQVAGQECVSVSRV